MPAPTYTLTVNRKAFLAALQAHKNNVASKSTLLALEYIHIDPAAGTLHTVCNHTFNHLRTPASFIGHTANPEPILLHYRRLVDALKSVTAATVDIEYSDKGATVRAGKISLSIPAMSAEEFPPFPRLPDVQPTPLPPGFGDALKRTLPAASTDEARPILCAVHVVNRGKGEMMVETADGFRLYRVNIPAPAFNYPEVDYMIPATAAPFLMGANDGGDVYYIPRGGEPSTPTGPALYIRAGDIELAPEMSAHFKNYPDLEQVIPTAPPCGTYTASLADWMEAIKPLKSNKETALLRVSATSTGLTFAIGDENRVELALELTPDVFKYEKPLNFGVNVNFLADTLEQAGATGEKVSLNTPCIETCPFTVKAGAFLAVLMPMHIGS